MKRDGTLCDAPCSPGGCLDCVERRPFQQEPEIRYALAARRADALREAASAARLLVPSRSHGEAVARHLGIETRRAEVLPLAPHAELEPAPRPPPGSKLRMVYFSHLYPHKGPELLIEAFLKMKHRERAELHLFGKAVLPDFFEKLQALAAGLDVTFHGAYRPKDLEAFPMDLVVIPSLVPESYSFILDEANALQAPVLAPDAGAIPERARGAAMLYRRGDPDDLARAMDRAASERALLDAMRGAPRIRVMAMEEHLDRLERIYGEAVKQGPPAAVPDGLFRGRLVEQWERREFNFRELHRSMGWEALAASLRQRIAELERALSERPPPS
jgi:glycosyltransferase involved in cell wall biosynthesis